MFINASTKKFTLLNNAIPSNDSTFEHLLYYKMVANVYYSKTKTSWHLWAEPEISSTMPNFHLRAVFFVMESNIAFNLEIKYIEYFL